MDQIVKIGNVSINYIGEFLKANSPKSIFFVTGRSSFAKCGAQSAIEPILKNYKFTRFFDFQENPKIEDVKRGVQLFNKEKCDFIISVGGGSVMDMAKLINYYCNIDNLDLITGKNTKNNKFNAYKHICVPTTAGSGSEATHFAVMYVNNIKYSIADDELKPDYVILDPCLHLSQTAYQKAVSGADALSQSIESLWSINATEQSMKFSLKALELIWNNLVEVVEGGSQNAHLNVALGSYYAGKAINIAKTTAPHALSYGITTMYRIPHGHAVSLFLPYFFNKHLNITIEECNDAKGINHLKNKMQEVASLLNLSESKMTGSISQFFKEIGLELSFINLGIDLEGYLKATENVNMERIANNPSIVNREVISDIFQNTNS